MMHQFLLKSLAFSYTANIRLLVICCACIAFTHTFMRVVIFSVKNNDPEYEYHSFPFVYFIYLVLLPQPEPPSVHVHTVASTPNQPQFMFWLWSLSFMVLIACKYMPVDETRSWRLLPIVDSLRSACVGAPRAQQRSTLSPS